MNKPYFLAVVGPTASGKSALAIQLAKRLNGVIISMDSMQIYRGMDIGTAKISDAEKENVIHEMIDIIDPKDEFSVGEYVRRCGSLIRHYSSQGMLPILTGGTALYLKALIQNFGLGSVPADEVYRAQLYQIAGSEIGKLQLHSMLRSIDKQAAEKLHPNDVRRIVRALEVYKMSGKRFSEQQDREFDTYRYCLIGLTDDRSALYERINKRVLAMMNQGLLFEVQALINSGVNFSMQSMQGIGYKEFKPYFESGCTLEDTTYQIQLNSRHYAKRQLTFFRSFPNLIWLDRRHEALTSTALDIVFQSDLKGALFREH